MIYKCPIQMYKMSLTVYHSLSTSLVKFYIATDEKKYPQCFIMTWHSYFKATDE